jgi:hypothetical protein
MQLTDRTISLLGLYEQLLDLHLLDRDRLQAQLHVSLKPS